MKRLLSGSQRFLAVFWPMLATGIIYDSMRLFVERFRSRVHVAEPYLFDKTLFGIKTAQGILTPNEWFALHTHWTLDLLAGFAYLTFILAFVAGGFYLYFVRKEESLAKRYVWSFFLVNILGYITYHAYAAAPPWYAAQFGFGPVKLDVLPNPAGCARFDALLGVEIFARMYSKSANVFGAVPSLHVAYPLICFLYLRRYRIARWPAGLFWILINFSALYLNHHYVLDILLGGAYAAMSFALVESIASRTKKLVPSADTISLDNIASGRDNFGL